MVRQKKRLAAIRIFGIKSQVSVEQLMMIAISMLTLIPLLYIFYTYSQSSTSDIKDARIYNIARNIVANSESIYYLGEPSRVTIVETFPEGIHNLTIRGQYNVSYFELVFELQDQSSIVVNSNIPLNGTFMAYDFTAGPKEILIASYGSYVNISVIRTE